MTLILTRTDVASLLNIDDCITAVEDAFRLLGQQRVPPPAIAGVHATDGGFHIKAALIGGGAQSYFAAKINGNFFYNAERFKLPRIQGVIVLCDGANGTPLAVMDSVEITILRTGAATAVAARHLARKNARSVLICGCGLQGRIQLRSVARVLSIESAMAFDSDGQRAATFAEAMSAELGIAVRATGELEAAAARADVIVTCTPSKKAFLMRRHVRPGTFVAAVGADSEDKQELDPELMAGATVVADVVDQCASIGDLHHAIAAGTMTRSTVHADLSEVVAGVKPGRTSDDEITIFDSTGMALQDVAAARIVYERALEQGRGVRIDIGS